MLIEMRKKNQITLPLELVKQFGLQEGDLFAVEVNNKQIILKPALIITKDQLTRLQDKNETYLASESTLKTDWLDQEEEVAWKNL